MIVEKTTAQGKISARTKENENDETGEGENEKYKLSSSSVSFLLFFSSEAQQMYLFESETVSAEQRPTKVLEEETEKVLALFQKN
jgi:hypothetical protein